MTHLRLRLSLTLLGLLLPCALTAQGSWSRVAPLPEYADLLDVDMVDPSLIVAVGTGGSIRRSVDSGMTWATIESPIRPDFRAVSFVHPVAGVAVGTDGMIVRTIDAGATWTDRPSGTSADLNDVASVKDTMVAVGADGTMIRSLDWSASWVPLPALTGNDLHAVDFLGGGSETGIAVGDGGVVLRSDDAGATWRVIREGNEDLRAIALLDSLNWFIVGDRGEMIVSDDGGESWVKRPASAGYRYTALHMFDPLDGFALGTMEQSGYEEPFPRITRDGGMSWEGFGSSLFRLNGGLDFIDSLHGALVGDDGTIIVLKENNGSPAFRVGFIPHPTQYKEIERNGSGEAIVVGGMIEVIDDDERIVRRDRTDLVAVDPAILPYPMNAVAPIGSDGAWIAVGDSGAVLRRAEFDSVWHAIDLSPTTRFVDVAFRNARIGAVAGLPTAIFLTRNGGFDWDTLSAPAEGVTQIFWWSDTTLAAYARIENALYTYSTVSGEWSDVQPLGTEPVDRIDVVDRLTAYGFGGHVTPQSQGDRQNDLVVGTTDGGETWTTLLDEETGGASFGLLGGDFWDADHGVGVGRNGKMVITHNGGETWQTVEIPADVIPPLTTLVDVVMTGPASGMILSSNGDFTGGIIARFTLEITSVDDAADGLDDLDLTAYPNPTRGGTIRVRWEGSVFAGGLIATVDGRIIGRVDAENGAGEEIEVTLPVVTAGVYHLLLRSESESREVPIIVTE